MFSLSPVLSRYVDKLAEKAVGAAPASSAVPASQGVGAARLHAAWNQTAVRTGRLSCSRPNLQQASGGYQHVDFNGETALVDVSPCGSLAHCMCLAVTGTSRTGGQMMCCALDVENSPPFMAVKAYTAASVVAYTSARVLL